MTHIKQRIDFASTWTTNNPVLMKGEVGWEEDTRKAKIGDGSTRWNTLPYAVSVTVADLNSRAPINSPELTGTPKAPTPALTSDDTRIATSAFVRDVVLGRVINLGNVSGAVSLSTSVAANTAMNVTVKATLTGNVTLTAATMPVAEAGTQFAMILTQDGVGSRTLTLTNILKPGGSLALSPAANSADVLVFFYDGTSWFATLSGKGFVA